MSGILTSVVLFDGTTKFPGFAALLPAVSTVLLLRACGAQSTTLVARFLKLRGFQEIGRLSYSWYLWHWPVLVFAGAIHESLPLIVRLGLVLFSLVLAEGSYRWLENPVRHSNFLSQKPSRSIVMGVMITVFSISLSLGWIQIATSWAQQPGQLRYTQVRDDIPLIYDNGCHADIFSTAPKLAGCEVGVSNRNASVVLFGDSHAAQWYTPLAKTALAQGWQFISMTKTSCPYVDTPIFSKALGREYTECGRWRQNVLEEIRKMHPDLVIVTSFANKKLVNADWNKGSDRTIKLLSSISRNVAIIRDTPSPEFDVPSCLARRTWRVHTILRSSCEILGGERSRAKGLSFSEGSVQAV